MKIVIDIDDVLADTFGAFEKRFGVAADPSVENLTIMFPGADIESVIDSIEFNMSIPPISGAVKGVSWLLESGHEAIYLSSRPPMMEEATDKWLKTYGFPKLSLQCLGRDSKKSVLRTSQYDLLIDDQVRYLTIAQERGKRVVAFACPWNTNWDGGRVDSWTGLKDFI